MTEPSSIRPSDMDAVADAPHAPRAPAPAYGLAAFLARSRAGFLWLALVVMGVVYVGNAWTPSHYGVALTMLGAGEGGPDLGKARSIRSDEWIVMTPYFQMAVRNGFETENRYSPYHESLKTFWALPLADWSLPFKPQLWAFFVIGPAQAYSLYFYLLFASFLVGWHRLFVRLGVSPALAFCGTVAVLFSQFPQVWWTSNAPTLALAPWVGIVFLARWRWWVKLPVLSYVSAVWLFGLLYPPFIISTAFVLFVAMLAARPDAFRPPNIAVGVLAAGMAAGLVYLYFGDLFAVMSHTVYPGQRISQGGGVPGLLMLSHLLPFASAVGFKPILPATNACEIGVVGTFLPLMALVFVEYRALLADWRCRWPCVALLSAGGLMMAAWMVLPVPSWAGMPLLWHYVPPNRMLFASGTLLTIAVLVLFTRAPWRLSWPRLALFATILVAAWLFGKRGLPDDGLIKSWWDGVVLLLLPLAIQAGRLLRPSLAKPAVLLAGAAALTNLVTFGTFNPLQSAEPIFDPPDTPFLRAAKELAAAHPQGWAALEGHYGALLNGVGIPAITHVQVAPQLDFFRKAFPELPAPAFNETFNRYAHLTLNLVAVPRVAQADHVVLPIRRFVPPFRVETTDALTPTVGGAADSAELLLLPGGKRRLFVRGWAPFRGMAPDRQKVLIERGSAGVTDAWAFRTPRLDVAASRGRDDFALAGLVVSMELTGSEGPGPAIRGLGGSDAEVGEFRLGGMLLVDVGVEPEASALPIAGRIERMELLPDGTAVTLQGVAPAIPSAAALEIQVDTSLPVSTASVNKRTAPGADGQPFTLTLKLEKTVERGELSLCVTGETEPGPAFQLARPDGSGSCTPSPPGISAP